MQMADVLVTVPLEKYTALDYDKAAEMIRLGYEAAEKKSAILSKLAVDDAAWKQYLEQRESRTLKTPVPQFIEVTGTTPTLAKRIERRLSPDVGKPVDNVNLEHQFTRIAGTGRFASLSYSMTDKDGKPGLLVSVEEKSYSPPIVRPLINIDGTNYNEVLFSAGARITFLDFGTLRFRTTQRRCRGLCLSIGIGVLSSVHALPRDGSSLRRSPSTPTNFISTSTITSTRNTGSDSLAERSMSDTPSARSAEARLGLPGGLSTIFTGDWRYDHLSHPIRTRRDYPVSLQSRPGRRSCSADARHDWLPSAGNGGTRIPGPRKPSPSAELRTHFLFPLNPEILRLSCCVRRYDPWLREHRDSSVFFGRRTCSSLPLARTS